MSEEQKENETNSYRGIEHNLSFLESFSVRAELIEKLEEFKEQVKQLGKEQEDEENRRQQAEEELANALKKNLQVSSECQKLQYSLEQSETNHKATIVTFNHLSDNYEKLKKELEKEKAKQGSSEEITKALHRYDLLSNEYNTLREDLRIITNQNTHINQKLKEEREKTISLADQNQRKANELTACLKVRKEQKQKILKLSQTLEEIEKEKSEKEEGTLYYSLLEKAYAIIEEKDEQYENLLTDYKDLEDAITRAEGQKLMVQERRADRRNS